MLMVLLMLTALSAAAFQLHPSPIHRAATPFSFLRQCGDDNARHHQVLARDHNRIIALSADDEDSDELRQAGLSQRSSLARAADDGRSQFLPLIRRGRARRLVEDSNEFFGDTAAAEPEEDDDNAEVNIFGGLHAAVQQAIADGESNKPDASGEATLTTRARTPERSATWAGRRWKMARRARRRECVHSCIYLYFSRPCAV